MMQTFVRPSRDLRNHYAEISEMLKDHDHVIITNHGRGESVLINIEDYAKYEEFLHQRYVAEALTKANSRRLTPARSGQTTKVYGRRSMNSMTYKIKYLPLAVQDLNDIARYLSGFYPKTASRVLKEMRDKIAKLGDNPKMCEIYPLDPVYRKMVVDQYLVFYQVNDYARTVEIHRILRGSWNLPQYLE